MSKNVFDVIVIGGGPAGVMTAYTLAKRGIEVLILEKEKFPRYKTCGGGLVPKAIQELPFEIDNVIERKCCISNVYDHYSKLHFVVKRDHPIISMTMRTNLDNHLIEQAVNAGAVFKDNEKVLDIIQNENQVDLITVNQRFIAKFVVSADGVIGITSKKFGFMEKVKHIPAVECELYVENDSFERFEESARFDFGFIPYGYAWIFPKKKHLSVGVLTLNSMDINLNEVLDRYIEKIGITGIIKKEKHGFRIPAMPRKKYFVLGRLILVGDAAGFTDPVLAEGISNALLSGKIAAAALISGKFDPRVVAEFYNVQIKRTILKELFYAKLISKLVYPLPLVRKFLFRFYGQKLCELMTDVFSGMKSYSSIIKNPMSYLKLLKPYIKNKNKFIFF